MSASLLTPKFVPTKKIRIADGENADPANGRRMDNGSSLNE